MFSKPKIPEQKIPAPAIDQPIKEPEAPDMGAQETTAEKKKKGKKGLRIEKTTTATSGKGTSIG